MLTFLRIALVVALILSVSGTILLFALEGFYGGNGGFVVGGFFLFVLDCAFGYMVYAQQVWD